MPTPQVTPVSDTPESDRLNTFMRLMERHNITEEEVRRRSIIAYGSLEYAMQATECIEAEKKAAMERISHGHYDAVGRKPRSDEEVTFSQLRDDLIIRVWSGDLANYRCYSFDFVNNEHQYMRTPDDIKIYCVATAFTPGLEVLSIEQSLERAMEASPQFARSLSSARNTAEHDPNWETYVVPEGITLRITQQSRPDRFLHIPVRTPNDSVLVLQHK
ncbi:hypothetical protein AX17_007489 [Amanita inopinata Kibby_2008]|nr:hypothetical protein AX17_007489 [Amanita inopinata Kibby_2008]